MVTEEKVHSVIPSAHMSHEKRHVTWPIFWDVVVDLTGSH